LVDSLIPNKTEVVAINLILFKKSRPWLIPSIAQMSFMTLLNLLNMVSGSSSALANLPRMMRNFKVVNIWIKIIAIPNNGANGAITKKNVNLLDKEYFPDDNQVADLEAAEERESGTPQRGRERS
jgi:hypothetical protein